MKGEKTKQLRDYFSLTSARLIRIHSSSLPLALPFKPMFSSVIVPSATALLVPVPRQARGTNSAAARALVRASKKNDPTIEAEVDLFDGETSPPPPVLRRQALAALTLAASAPAFASPAPALAAFQPPGFKKDLTKGAKRRGPLPAEAFSQGPEGLKFHDFKVGTGPEATLGDRVVVHYEARWKGERRELERERERGGEMWKGEERVGRKEEGLTPALSRARGKQKQQHGEKKKKKKASHS